MRNFKCRVHHSTDLNEALAKIAIERQGFVVKGYRLPIISALRAKYDYVFFYGINGHLFINANEKYFVNNKAPELVLAHINLRDEEPELAPVFDNIMVDIETLGTEPGDIILTIAAIPFNIETGITGTPFYEKISLGDSIVCGFSINPGTMDWWWKQDPKIFREALSGTKTAQEVINGFSDWVEGYGEITAVKVWGNSNRFDLGLLNAYFKEFDLALPWKYSNERDVRTLVAFKPEVKKEMVLEAKDLHNAVNDCYLQIKYCHAIFTQLKPE